MFALSTKNYQVSVPVASDANDCSRFAGVTVLHLLSLAAFMSNGNAGASSLFENQMLIGPSLTAAVP